MPMMSGKLGKKFSTLCIWGDLLQLIRLLVSF
uniref:Uncharacterized protein n=1 Tax=Arundo donax TaxID=35708 RepID=A0A0A9H4V7_ARUDO